MYQNIFWFNGKYYIQTNEIAIENPQSFFLTWKFTFIFENLRKSFILLNILFEYLDNIFSIAIKSI